MVLSIILGGSFCYIWWCLLLYWLVSSVILRGTFKDEHWYLVFRKLPSVLLDGTISTSERGTISVVSSGMSFDVG